MDTPIYDEVRRKYGLKEDKSFILATAISESLKEEDPRVWVRPLASEVLKWLKVNGWTLRRR